jgi:PPOX class probable F420-dependent enzyme
VSINIDEKTEFGARVSQRLHDELVIWLTTVGPDGMPHPRPVWFIWENDSFVIFSMPGMHKLKHIEQNAKVALHFDGGHVGEDIQVFLGQANLEPTPVSQAILDAYVAKYGTEIVRIGFTLDKFKSTYTVALRVTPNKVRGMS